MTYRLGDMLLELRDPNTSQQRVDEITRELNELGDREERYKTILTLRGVIVENVETPDGSVRIAPGQFFLGNGVRPGEGYSGIRMEYPAFEMNGEEWNLAGVENDTLQFGVRASDGKAIAGGGDVSLDNQGVWIANQSGVFGFEDTSGQRYKIYLYSDGVDALALVNKKGGPASSIRLAVDTATHKVLYMLFGEHPYDAEVPRLKIYNTDSGEPGANLVMAGGVDIWSGVDYKETVFNEDGYKVSFRVEGDSDAVLFFVDSVSNRVGIGTNYPSAKLDVNSDMICIRTSKTPTGTADPSGSVGSIAWDANYIYVKTGSGWKRATLSTF